MDKQKSIMGQLQAQLDRDSWRGPTQMEKPMQKDSDDDNDSNVWEFDSIGTDKRTSQKHQRVTQHSKSGKVE